MYPRLYALRKAEERGAVASVRYVVLSLCDASVAEEYMCKKDCARVTNDIPKVVTLSDYEWDPSYDLTVR